MLSKSKLLKFSEQKRLVRRTRIGARFSEDFRDAEGITGFGPLEGLLGKWESLPGHGWNMIALPFATKPGKGSNYRLLLNQYDEEFDVTELAGPVPNRGIGNYKGKTIETDQFLAALQYFQDVTQIAAADFPVSGQAGDPNSIIHQEPGLWLHMTNQTTKKLDIARLGSVPHGDSLLALGAAEKAEGAPKIPKISGLPVGVDQSLKNPYLAPYKHFNDKLFQGVFDPVNPNALLKVANKGVPISETTSLTVDTTLETGGITNIPFVVKQANATEMKFTFWISRLDQKDDAGNPLLRLQYSQLVFLEFFERKDGKGLIRWPHVSINTLIRKDQKPFFNNTK